MFAVAALLLWTILLCSSADATIAVSWSSWTSGACSVTCGIGTRTYRRTCKETILILVHTVASKYCHGAAYSQRTCQEPACPGPHNSGSVHIHQHFSNFGSLWENWSLYGPCSRSCGGGYQTRVRTCTSTYWQGCSSGSDFDSRSCNDGPCTPSSTGATKLAPANPTKPPPTTATTSMTSTKLVTKTTVATGDWGPWGAWGDCSTTCGSGTATRTRYCPRSGTSCVPLKSNTELQWCDKGDCDGAAWSAWGAWGACSVTCDRGQKTRSRTCLITGTTVKACQERHSESEPCEASHPCAVAMWSDWFTGSCSVTCGLGTAHRLRHCSSGNDADCFGTAFDQVACSGQNAVCS